MESNARLIATQREWMESKRRWIAIDAGLLESKEELLESRPGWMESGQELVDIDRGPRAATSTGNVAAAHGYLTRRAAPADLACAAVAQRLPEQPGVLCRRRRRKRGRCPRCGYDRRGVPPAAPCPECGTPASKHRPAHPAAV